MTSAQAVGVVGIWKLVFTNGSNDGLVNHSMELERIPSDPILTYVIDENGDAKVGHSTLIDGGTVVNAPTSVVKTGLASWQMLY